MRYLQKLAPPAPLFLIMAIMFGGIAGFLITVPQLFGTILYGTPAVIGFWFYSSMRLKLADEGVFVRNFFFRRKSMDWASVTSIKSNKFQTIIVESGDTIIKIPQVYGDKEFSRMVDFIIKRVDKSSVSTDLLAEWSKSFALYSDEFKK